VQRLRYAYRFIKSSFSQAIKEPRLRKPWFNLWMGGISLTIVWLLPLGAVIVLIGLDPLGMTLIGLLSILLLVSLLVWGEVNALDTCRVFDAQLRGDQGPGKTGTEDRTQDFSHWKDAALWLVSLPGLKLRRLLTQVFRSKTEDPLVWLEAAYLMLPVISLEDHNLVEATGRIKHILQENLLRFNQGLFAVSPLAGIIQGILVVSGALLGFWVGFAIADPATSSGLSLLFAAAIGVFLGSILALLGIFFSSFNRACYYTTLYNYALSVEAASLSGNTEQRTPPAILSQVLRKTTPN